MSSTTELIDSLTGKAWLIGPIRPIVAATAVAASTSGTDAATSAPKAISRISSVTGSDVYSACLKSSSKLLDRARSELSSPDLLYPQVRVGPLLGLDRASAATTLSEPLSSRSSTPKFTSAERPSREIVPSAPSAYGDSTRTTCRVPSEPLDHVGHRCPELGSRAAAPYGLAPAPSHRRSPWGTPSRTLGRHARTRRRPHRPHRAPWCRPSRRSSRRRSRTRASPGRPCGDAGRSNVLLGLRGCGCGS